MEKHLWIGNIVIKFTQTFFSNKKIFQSLHKDSYRKLMAENERILLVPGFSECSSPPLSNPCWLERPANKYE